MDNPFAGLTRKEVQALADDRQANAANQAMVQEDWMIEANETGLIIEQLIELLPDPS